MVSCSQASSPELAPAHKEGPLLLFGHCTERTEEVESQKQWQVVFRAFGLELQPQATGCCGMCGVFGHEVLENSAGDVAPDTSFTLAPQ